MSQRRPESIEIGCGVHDSAAAEPATAGEAAAPSAAAPGTEANEGRFEEADPAAQAPVGPEDEAAAGTPAPRHGQGAAHKRAVLGQIPTAASHG
jgi:hypothetical protein